VLRWWIARLRQDVRGFTLLELAIVVVVISLIAAIAVPVFLSQRGKAQDSATVQEVSQIVGVINAGVAGNWLAGVDPDEGVGEYTQGDVPADATTGFATAADFQADVPEGKVRIASAGGVMVIDADTRIFANVEDAYFCVSKESPTGKIYGATSNQGQTGVQQVVGQVQEVESHCNEYSDPLESPGTDTPDPEDYIDEQDTGPVAQMSAGREHTCAVTTDGYAYCWGRNVFGELGNNSTTNSNVPVKVVDRNGFVNGQVKSVSAGAAHTCAVTRGDKVYCWGFNYRGRLGDGIETFGHTIDTAPASSVPLEVVNSADGGFVNGEVRSVSAGEGHTCAVTTGDTVYCWGLNSFDQLGIGYGFGSSGVPVKVVNGSEGFVNGSVESVSAGFTHTCAVTNDGYAYCWGARGSGRLGDGNDEDYSSVPVKVVDGTEGFVNGSVESVSAGGQHTCAVTTGGTGDTVYCWGYNGSGSLGNNSTTDSPVPVKVVDANGFVNGSVESVATGYEYSCAVTTENEVYCWGRNRNGQLGNGQGGSFDDKALVPVKVVNGSQGFDNESVRSVITGNEHACAVTTDGYAYCWGWNRRGQRGDNSPPTRSLVPVMVVNGTEGFENGGPPVGG